MRGLAIALVLAYHFVAFSEPASLVERALVQVCDFGAAGVDLFFLLSGFLITGILVETRGRSHFFRNFYTRRVLRIFPLYYGVLVAVFLIAPRIPGLHSAQLDKMRQSQAWAWLYAMNIYLSTHGSWSHAYLDHFWSLSIEEHFYFFWPVVVWALGGRPRRLMQASIAIALLSRGTRFIADVAGAHSFAVYALTH